MEKVIAAAIQYEPAMYAGQVNEEELCFLTEQAAAAGARIIVLPEMATTGYGWSSREELSPYVETIPGPTTDRFLTLTRKYGCYVVIGLAEVDPQSGIYYNAAALLGPEGLVGSYRKTHLFVSDPKWAAVGDLGLPVWDTEYGRLGIAICLDLEFPEVARVLALKGAQMIAFPCNWLGETCPSALWMTRALENEVCVIAANRWGRERGIKFSGGSCVIGPQGNILAYRGSGNGIVLAELPLCYKVTQASEPVDTAEEIPTEVKTGLETNDEAMASPPSPIIEPHDQRETALSTGAEIQSTSTTVATSEYLKRRRPELYQPLLYASHLWRPELFFNLEPHHPLPPGRESQIGIVQFEIAHGKREANLTRMQQWVARAKSEYPELQLLVFPELANTGLVSGRMSELAEPIPGITTTYLSQVARDFSLYLAWGMVERGPDGTIYITAVLAGPEGRIHTYRKTHLLARDEVWAQPGAVLPNPIDIPIGRLGLLLGTDLLFPEAARCLAAKGVDLIVVPAALAGPGPLGLVPGRNLECCSPEIEDPFHWCIWRIRAWENSVFLAVANKAGKGEVRRGMNISGIFNPVPYERCEPCKEILIDSMEGLLVTTISTSRANREGRRVRAKDNLRRRYTGLYSDLVSV
ncbi:MAG: amidohydrolase [Syntrophomonadaceae bacterium]|nr:amidohydrolase [Syntrophomonadaceae bacterium]